MSDRILCASRPFMDMYIYSMLAQRDISPKDIDIEDIISNIRLTGRVDLVLSNIRARE